MCALTAAQALFPRLGLPSPFSPGSLPSDNPVNILIYGSSTSLGQFGAQLVHWAAQASGRVFRLFGTASPSKHELLRAAPYSYDLLVDYHEGDWDEKIRAATGGIGVHFALDTISERDSVEKVHSTLRPEGKYHVFRSQGGGQFDTSKLDIQPVYGTVWEGLGHEVDYGEGIHCPPSIDTTAPDSKPGLVFPAPPEAREFAAKFFEFLGSEAETGNVKLHPNPVRKMPGGLERIVPDAFSLLSGLVSERKGFSGEEHLRPISGEKLVYSMQ